MTANALNLKNILSEIDESRIDELRAIFDEYYPQDIAEEFDNLDKNEKQLLFDILSFKQGALVIVELEYNQIKEIFDFLSNDQITKFCNQMELDDAADILSLLDDERMLKILEQLQKPFEIKELLSFEPDTCGGIMTPGFISVRADLKIGAALRYLRLKAKETGNTIMYIYVTKKFGELVGVISLRELFLAPDENQVSEHMNNEVISVKTSDDQSTAADLISKYRFLAIPVMNDDKQLVGIITIDDIVEVIEEEVTEDIYQSSGINVNSDVGIDFGKSLINRFYDAYRARTPWLIITLLGQYFAATLIASFNMTIAAIPIAISFMPLLSGMSGNIGNQSSTIIIRGLATGEVEMNKGSKILFHEILISIMIGVTCAGIVGALSFYVYKNVLLSALIALSLIVSMMLAVGLGTITPMAFKKMDLDPAAASGPLITTGIDVLSFFVYLTLITKFISDLV